MSKIIYNPEDAGKSVLNSKGKLVKIRKYHLTEEEKITYRDRWLLDIADVDDKIKRKAGEKFFNPYRKGIYYYQIQTLFLLGANVWHSLPDIVYKLENYTSGIPVKKSIIKEQGYHTAWDKFRGKSSRQMANTSKDYIGRIQENFIFFQRLSKLHPYGYKLYQVCSAVDIKRVSVPGFQKGAYFYRLSTYNTPAMAFPIRDFSKFEFDKHEGKYVNHRFIGTIVTKDKILKNNEVLV